MNVAIVHPLSGGVIMPPHCKSGCCAADTRKISVSLRPKRVTTSAIESLQIAIEPSPCAPIEISQMLRIVNGMSFVRINHRR
jgi:hypothetical protein